MQGSLERERQIMQAQLDEMVAKQHKWAADASGNSERRLQSVVDDALSRQRLEHRREVERLQREMKERDELAER